VIVLPATQLLDLKAAAGALMAALACIGLAWAWGHGRGWRPQASLRPSWEAWRWSTVAVAGYALAQRLGIEPVTAYAQAGSHSRAMGPFGNAGYLAAYLCLSWPMLLAWTGARRGLAVALAWAALLAAQSRAGAVALALQGAVAAVHAWRGGWRPGGAALAAAAALMAGALALFPVQAWSRPTLRLPLWRASWGLWLQRPWLGWGPGRFAAAFQAQADPGFVRALNAGGQVAEDPHQVLLTVACAGGVLGLAAFIVAVAWALKAARRSAVPGAALGLVGILAQSQADRFFFQAGVLGPLLLLAVALRWEGSVTPRSPRWRALALAPALLALALLAAGAKPLLAYAHAVGPDLGAGAGAIAPSATVEQLRSATQGSVEPAAFERLGAALAAKQQWAEAAAAYRTAEGLGPSVGRAQNLGNCSMMLGDARGAEAAFRKAVELDPQSSDARFSLGYALFYQKRLTEAVDQLDLALKLDPGNASAQKLKEQIQP
jgi:tetratricopeptide (TPR) repeat protein